jgi:hypothetical protein
MSQKNSDLLSLYAGLDIDYSTTGIGAVVHRAMSCFFNKAENTLAHLQARRDNGKNTKQQTKVWKEAI